MAFKDGTINPRRVINLKIMCLLMTDGPNMELIVLSDVFKYTLKRGIVLRWKNKRLHLVGKMHSGAPLTGGKEFDEIDLKAKDSHGEYIIDKDAHTICSERSKYVNFT